MYTRQWLHVVSFVLYFVYNGGSHEICTTSMLWFTFMWLIVYLKDKDFDEEFQKSIEVNALDTVLWTYSMIISSRLKVAFTLGYLAVQPKSKHFLFQVVDSFLFFVLMDPTLLQLK